MLITINGAKCIGIEAMPISIEIDITQGLGIHLVGLADIAVKESLLRIITALQSLGFRIPGKKIVINLAPADLHKSGSGYDLPIAIGVLAASGQIRIKGLSGYIIMGELGLNGSIRKITGALPIADFALQQGFKCILPKDSAIEAREFAGHSVYGCESLEDVLEILKGESDCDSLLAANLHYEEPLNDTSDEPPMDFSEIVGQELAKRGLEIAAAGGHNVLLIGPPGAGKSTLAKAMAAILPPMTREESVQTSKIYSVSGLYSTNYGLLKKRPFRSPHTGASSAALTGGGHDRIMPGEISLAHNGVLFLDEFCEIPKKVIEALRGPMEDKRITISRLRSKLTYPASFLLVAATNPCPCGYYGEGDKCTCSPAKRLSYMDKLSGPIMDRFDLHIWLKAVDAHSLVNNCPGESSASVALRVRKARKIQDRRFSTLNIHTNAEMNIRQLEKFCPLDEDCRSYLEKIVERHNLSARACHKIIKIARTIADLENMDNIDLTHLSEAAAFRFLDKNCKD